MREQYCIHTVEKIKSKFIIRMTKQQEDEALWAAFTRMSHSRGAHIKSATHEAICPNLEQSRRQL